MGGLGDERQHLCGGAPSAESGETARDHARQHVPGSRCRQPGVAGGRYQRSAVGIRYHGGAALEQHDCMCTPGQDAGFGYAVSQRPRHGLPSVSQRPRSVVLPAVGGPIAALADLG